MKSGSFALPLALALVLALGARPRVAFGEDDPALKEATVLYQQGLALVDQAKVSGDRGRFEEARRKFLAAYELSRRPNPLFSLALAEKNLERSADALHHFRKFVREPGAEPARIEQAKMYIRELAAVVASLQIEAPAGAEIFFDGVSTGDTAPLAEAVDLVAGRHTFEARLGDRTTGTQAIDAAGGTTTRVHLTFPPSPAAPVAPSAETTSLPASYPLVAPVQPSGPERPHRSGTARTVTLVTLAGATGVAVAFGLGFSLAAGDAGSTLAAGVGRASYGCSGASASACRTWSDAAQSHARDTNLAVGSFVAAGALATGWAGAWLFWPNPSASSSARALRVVPSMGPASASATLVGTF